MSTLKTKLDTVGRIDPQFFNEEQFYTEQEISSKVRRSIPSLRRDRMLRQGLPYVRFGRLVRYPASGLREYYARHLCGNQ